MGNDIKIDYGEVLRVKLLIGSLVGTGIATVGKAVCQSAVEAIRESGGEGLIAAKAYMNQEQEMMNVMGEGFNYLINHLEEAAKALSAVDEHYAVSHVE